MWDRLISINPNFIRFYNIRGYYSRGNEKLVKKALDKGYIINEEDLRINKNLQRSNIFMRKAIEVNYNYIRYYNGSDEELIDSAINNGYQPNMKDLQKNNNLGISNKLMKILIENGQLDAIKYYQNDDEDLIKKALDKGYQIKEEDLKLNGNLRHSDTYMSRAIEIDPNYIKYYYGFDKLIDKAINDGYIPNMKDLEKNDSLGHSTKLIEYLIENGHPEAIKFFRMPPYVNSKIYELAFSKGYVPTKNDLKNSYIGKSDIFMEYLIKKDYNYILQYKGDNESIFELAYNLGFNEKKIINSVKYSNLIESKFMMKKILDYDINIFEKYFCDDLNKAVEVGYIPPYEKLMTINHPYTRNSILEKIILNDPSYIKLYNGNNEETYLFALNKGYLPNEDTIKKNYKIQNTLDIMSSIVKLDHKYINYFDKVYELALKILALDYVPTFAELEQDYVARSNYQVIKKIISIKPEYVEHAHIDNDKKYFELLMEAIKNYNYRPSIDARVRINFEIASELIKCDLKYVKLAQYFKLDLAGKLYDLAYDLGYRPSCNFNLSDFSYSDKIMSHYINLDYSCIRDYDGTNTDVFKLALQKGYPIPSLDDILNPKIYSYKQMETNEIIYLIINNDFSILSKLDYFSSRVMSIALALGYVPSINVIEDYNYKLFDDELLKKVIINSTVDDCLEFVSRMGNLSDKIVNYIKDKMITQESLLSLNKIDNKNYRLFEEDLIKNIIVRSSTLECISFIARVDLSDEIIEYILKQKKINAKVEYFNILTGYSYDKELFLTKYDLYTYFLNKMNIKESSFIQYGFNVDYDWFNAMLNIINSGKLDEFIGVKDYFDKYVYLISEDSNDLLKIKSFINILTNYQKYSELCVSIKNENRVLESDLIDNIRFLFNSNDGIDVSLIKNIDDLLNLTDIFKDKYQMSINDQMNIIDIKEVLCKLLFNMDLSTVNSKLKIYGDTKVLRQLIFNNRNNNEIIDLITEMMIYTSMMEGITSCNDLDYLKTMGKNILDNYEMSLNCMILFNDFDEKMRILYEKELMVNLTTLNDNIDGLLDKELSKKYGVDVIDFSNKKYCLVYHVKSRRETTEELVYGKSSRDKSTICVSNGSNRNQVVYWYDGYILATDEIQECTFIRSSTRDMGSNGSVVGGSFEDSRSDKIREQRGALETSTAPYGDNSEGLFFREGMKFKYIILPGGREPTTEQLEDAKKYELKFIKTQELNHSIDNPENIDVKYLKNKQISSNEQIEKLKKLKNQLFVNNNKPRQIVIYSDSHGLFEPTLAILEYARLNGISEIYSLGDDIGGGPNPKEVLELHKEYGVKSIKGNHELYTIIGVDEFKSHLGSAYQEALDNSNWTRSQLTDEQIAEIKENPYERIIEIGGKKILLTHFMKDYNTGKEKEIPKCISAVFQGHIHFEKESLNGIITLRGAGIGNQNDNQALAYCLVLTEKEDGYDIEKVLIPYDRNNLKYDILESSMNGHDKSKMGSWVGVKR